MMKLIDFNSFMDFCNKLVGKELHTLYQAKPFVLKSAENERLDWVVKSTNKPRYSKKTWIQKYLIRYAKTGSLRPKDYKEDKLTESSYILPLIKLYVSGRM